MLGRTPDTIRAVRPLKDGVIADYRTTEAMIRYFINKTLGGIRFFRPEVMVAVPAGISSTERRAVIEATISAGAKAAYIIKEPVAAAIGADIPIGSATGHMVIDIGGGTAEMAVISLGGIVSSTSVRVGGNKFDAAILEFVRKKYNLAIGERTAEEIKINIGSALFMEDKLYMKFADAILLPVYHVALRFPLMMLLKLFKMSWKRLPSQLKECYIPRRQNYQLISWIKALCLPVAVHYFEILINLYHEPPAFLLMSLTTPYSV